jgi:hypothetical protein
VPDRPQRALRDLTRYRTKLVQERSRLANRPTFVLLDGSRVLFRSGPTGGSLSDVREGRTLVASVDSLAADAFGWDDLLERKGEELPAYFAKSAARGLGNPDWRALPMQEAQIG